VAARRRYVDPVTFEMVEVPDSLPRPPVRWGRWLGAGLGLILLVAAIVLAALLFPWEQ
jgi:predicted anti-sigma-YlaC factor YlaD